MPIDYMTHHFKNMNKATIHYDFGNLNPPALFHACGRTTNDVMVWLSIMRPGHSWDNRYDTGRIQCQEI